MIFKHILFKISGECMSGNGNIHDIDAINKIVQDIKTVKDAGIKISIVIGGGNILRGSSCKNIQRTTADSIGMLSTTINGLYLRDFLINHGIDAVVISALNIDKIANTCNNNEILEYVNSGKTIIFTCGTGNPFFSTDTCAVIRALEGKCDAIIKGTSVDGVYDSDPKHNPDARKLSQVSYDEIIARNLRIMDMSAISIAKEHKMPIYIISLKKDKPLSEFIYNKGEFSIIS